MSVVVNDPNDPNNTELREEYPVEYTINAAIKELYNRINTAEDYQGSLSNIFGTSEDFYNLD